MSKNTIINKDYDALIIEDESILAMGMKSKLEKIGLNKVYIATTPEKAILYAQNNYPDIAIVDINLNSSKNGIDVANYIWKNFNIPIIFLTSYYSKKIINEAMECEPYSYLLKPCRYKELEVAINMALHKHRFFFKNKEQLELKKEEFIQISKNIKFDKANIQLYVNSEIFKLTKKEKKLFEILSKEPGKVVNFDVIFSFIWREEVCDPTKLRALVYRLKKRLGFSPFDNLYEIGYKLKLKNNNA